MDATLRLPELASSRNTRLLSPFTWSNLRMSVQVKKDQKTSSEQSQSHADKSTAKRKPRLPKIAANDREEHLITEKLEPIKQQPKNPRKKPLPHQLLPNAPKNKKVGPLLSKPKAFSNTIQSINSTDRSRSQAEPKDKERDARKTMMFLDERNNMQQFMKETLVQGGWSSTERETKRPAKLVWANVQQAHHFLSLKAGQHYNHIQGSHQLTSKDKLHQLVEHCSFYPPSYLLPAQYEDLQRQNQTQSVLALLKRLSESILDYFAASSVEEQFISLDSILHSFVVRSECRQTQILLAMCLYLEQVRKQRRYMGYFERMPGNSQAAYNVQAGFDQQVLRVASGQEQLHLKEEQVDYRLLLLVVSFHRLFVQFDPTYGQSSVWICKPIGSSRGAGICLVAGESLQVEHPSDSFKLRKKYENKLLQQYIANPILLPHPTAFLNRKFDIRQWVLIKSSTRSLAIYRYHTAYCRFASHEYTLEHLHNDTYLTNYSQAANQSKLENVLMLGELQGSEGQPAGESVVVKRYMQQVDGIIETTVRAAQMKRQEGCFELFGFDLLMDACGKLWLLEVNLNPACQADRHGPLFEETQKMVTGLFKLVVEGEQVEEWCRIGGQEQSREQIEIKPFYSYELPDEESIISLVRNRQQALSRVINTAYKSLMRDTWGKLLSTGAGSQAAELLGQTGVDQST